MAQFNEDLELVADLLGAGLDISSAYSMYRDFLGDREANQATRQSGLQSLLGEATSYAASGTKKGGTKAVLEALGPAYGFAQGAQAPALQQGVRSLYPEGKVSPLFTPEKGAGGGGGMWGATEEERVTNLVSEAIANYPGAADEGNRDMVREFVHQDFQAILSPKDYAKVKPFLDASVDRNYATKYGTQAGLPLEEINALRDTFSTRRVVKPKFARRRSKA